MRDYVTTYEEAVEYIYRIPRFNSNHSLQNIEQFLAEMGQPDNKMKIVHIAGTNGKGSTSTYLAGLLSQTGLKVGLFTSPHLVDIRERFRINGSMISKELFLEAVQAVLMQLYKTSKNYEPCYFDMLFFVGMYAFAKEKVDVLILETGLGGRLDATNAVKNKAVTLITHIALDHTEQLGDTLDKIAGEKAGIMRPAVPCIVGAHNEKTAHVFLKKATELDCPCRILGKEDYGCQRVSEKSVAFSYFSSYYGTVQITLNTPALYQAENASLALAGLEELISQGILSDCDLTAEKIKKALFDTSWEGRMEEVKPGIFLDGAHNVDGIGAFLSSVCEDHCPGRRILIFSAVSDKNYSQMLLDILKSELFAEVIVTQIAGERGVNAETLYETLLSLKAEGDCVLGNKMICTCTQMLPDAIEQALTEQQHLDYIYIVGSLYLVGQTKKLLGNHEEFSAKKEGESV